MTNNKFARNSAAALALTFAVLGVGCVPPENAPVNTNTAVNTSTAPTNANTAPVNAPVNNTENAARMPVTLPVLDAMFFDENFIEELKSKLSLSDEQISQLKTISRQSVEGLTGEDSEESAGSTRQSTVRAQEQIRGVIGAEKANQLFDLVRTRWSNNESQMSSAEKPNAVPSDTRIVVNAPGYRMDVFQDGKLLKTYKIGIGYPEFPLPTGMRKAETVIFNPTWTPPDEPWVKGKVQPGKTVEAGSALNPLGPIKIPIGLPSLIHGGKNPARLGTFASHGCVGLTNAQVQDFSTVLAQISGSTLTPEDVKNYEKQKTETKNFKLNNAVPIELRYETIVVEDGKIKIFRDVYEHGTNTTANLKRVLETYGVSYDSLSEEEKQKLIRALNDMNKDAQGNAIVENVDSSNGAAPSNSANANSAANSNANKNSNANAQNSNSDDGKVTREIKGKKEVVIELAQLKGKGYPAPVQLNAGQK